MVKYGKEFRQAQKPEWKSKYFDYKKLKKQIKLYNSPVNHETDLSINKDSNNSSQWKRKNKTAIIKDFISLLNNEIKTIYLFFTREEKALHRNINKSLFSKDNYPSLDYNEFITEFNTLNEIASNAVDLANFVFYNLKALIKIVKKFDKKCLPNNTRHHIKIKYIQHKLEEQNSDVLDMYKFKVIDEVCAIIEDLVTTLKQCYKEKESSFKGENSNVLLNPGDDNKDIIENDNKLKVNFSASAITKEILNKVKTVDTINLKIKTLFEPWKDFLKISSTLTSKLYSLTKLMDENAKNEHFKTDSSNQLRFDISDSNEENFNKYDTSSISSNLPHIYKKEHSIMGNMLISQNNKTNIKITLFHTYLYFFSYSIQIPFHIKYLETLHYQNYYIGLVAAMAPIGAILSFTLSSTWSLYSTRKTLLFTMFLLLIGNLLCFLSKYCDTIYLLLIGRLIIGLGCNRIGNKMYLVNFIPKQYLSKYIIKFHVYTLLGLSFGFLINIPLILCCDENSTYSYIGIENIGALICCVLCFIGFVIALFCLKEGFDLNFYITTSYLNGKQINIMRNGKSKENDDLQDQPENMTIDESIRKDTFMIEDIDEKLFQANETNKFTETNLVSKSVTTLTKYEKTNLSFLKGNYIVFVSIVFTSKVINEFMLINSPLYLNETNKSFGLNYLSLLLGTSFIFVLMIEGFVYRIKKCFSDRISLLLLLSFIFILSLLLIIQFYVIKNSWQYYIGMELLIIISNLIEKTALSFFGKIIPNDYRVFDIQGNTVINIVSNIGRILGTMIPILSEKFGLIYMNIGTFVYFIILSVIAFIFMLLFYDDLRIKAISRIMFDKEKGHKLQIPNEI